MTPQQIIDGVSAKNAALTVKNQDYLDLSEKRAMAERDYNIAFAVAMLKYKETGQPATLIPALTKGDPYISKLKYNLDVAEGVLNACRESIKDLRTAIDTYRSLLTWLREEKKG